MTTLNDNRHNNEDLESFEPKNFHFDHNDSENPNNQHNTNKLPDMSSLDEEWRDRREAYVALKRSGNLRAALEGARDSVLYFSQYFQSDDYRITFIEYDVADFSMEYAKHHGTDYTEAIKLLEKIAPELDALFGKASFMYAYSQFKLSLCHIYSGRAAKGDALFQEALELLKKDESTAMSLIAGCYRQYGDYLQEHSRYDQALTAYAEGIKLLKQEDPIDKTAVDALGHLSKKVLQKLSSSWTSKSIDELKTLAHAPHQSIDLHCLAARTLMKRSYEAGNIQDAYYAAARASGLIMQHALIPAGELESFYATYARVVIEYPAASSDQQKALRLVEERYAEQLRQAGQFTPDPYDFWYDIVSDYYYDEERYAEALVAARLLALRVQETSGPYSLKSYNAAVMLTACLGKVGSSDDHEFAARKAAAIANHALSDSSDDYIYSRLMASRICGGNSNLSDALRYADEAETAFLKQSVRDYSMHVEVYENLALQHFSNGNYEEAQDALNECKKALSHMTLEADRRCRLFLHQAMFSLIEGKEDQVELQLLEAKAIIEQHSLEQTSTMIYYLSAKTQLYSHTGTPEALERGEKVAEDALNLAKTLYGTQSSDYCGQLRDLAGILFQRAQFYHDHDAAETALHYYEEARVLYERESSETYAYLRLLQASLEVLEFLNEQDEDLYDELSKKAESMDVMLGLKNSSWEEDEPDNLE